MKYTIQTEGRSIKEVIQVGKTVRVDLGYKTPFTKVFELKGFTYEYKFGHELPNGTRVYYVTITGIEQPEEKKTIPANKKRFVIRNDIQLSIESGYIDDKTGKYIPAWYIWDKVTNDIVDGYSYLGEGARTMAKKDADKLNIQGL